MSNEYDYSGLYNHTSDGQPAQPQSLNRAATPM